MLPGLVIQTEPKREYPDSSMVAHLVGYVGEVTEDDLAGAYAGRRPGTVVGKDGLERQYESTLAGSDGVRFVEVDALGRVVRDEGAAATLQAVPGHVLRTTIDLGLQRFVASIFPPGRRGAIVAMDPCTGDILALYSSPVYDPNAFVGGISSELVGHAQHRPGPPAARSRHRGPLPARLDVQAGHGAAWRLSDGLVDFDSRMPQPCRGGFQFGTRFFNCWDPRGHGSLTLSQAIANSCDTYFYQLGLKLSVKSHHRRTATRSASAIRTGIDLPGEVAPGLPRLQLLRPGLREGRLDAGGRPEPRHRPGRERPDAHQHGALLRDAGQRRTGDPAAHPGGHRTPDVGRVDLPDSVFLGIRNALIAVVEQGTARSVRMAQLQLAGKTGTAQNPEGPGPRLVHRLRSGDAADDRGRRRSSRTGCTARSWRPTWPGSPSATCSGPDTTREGARAAEAVPLRRSPEDTVRRVQSRSTPRRPAHGRRPLMLSKIDRRLAAVTLALTAYGMLILYSAGQTDVPSSVEHIWQRQLAWLVDLAGRRRARHADLARGSLEWFAPAGYAAGIFLLLLTLAIGTGAGTAASSHAWIAIGGVRVGQPSEIVKLLVVLMLARYLAARRDPPNTMRELVVPCRDRGACPRCWWPSSRTWAARSCSPASSSPCCSGPACACPCSCSWPRPSPPSSWPFRPGPGAPGSCVLGILLLIWRPFVWEGLAVLGANVVTGHPRPPAVGAPGRLPAAPLPGVPQPRPRSAGHRLAHHPVEDRHRERRLAGQGLSDGLPEAAGLPAGPAHGLHLLRRGRGAGVHRRPGGADAVLPPPGHRWCGWPAGARTPSRAWSRSASPGCSSATSSRTPA